MATPETHKAEVHKPRAPLPDPRLFRKEHPEFDAARAKARNEHTDAPVKARRDAQEVPGYRTNNTSAIDAAETAAINDRAQKDRKIPSAHQARHPVSVQTDPSSADILKVEAGKQTRATQKTMANPTVGTPVNLG